MAEDKNLSLEELRVYLARLQAQRIYGRVELTLQAGHITDLKETRSFKPRELQETLGR